MWIIHSRDELLLRKETILMRILFCKIHCPFICFCKPSAAHLYTSAPLKLENTPRLPVSDATPANHALTAVTEVNIEGGLVNGKPDAAAAAAAAPDNAIKSCIRKPTDGIQKKRVHWKDNLGKELAEIKEFESSETWETENEEEDNGHCVCVIL